MDVTEASKRKRYERINEQQWEQVRAFVKELFEQPEKASKATYRSLFKEIQSQYPCLILSPALFTKHVASIETLRANAGIQGEVEISRKYFQRVREIFHEILIGLPLDEFKSIKLEGLIQHADEGHPDLHIADKNRKTLADHCPIKQLKALARAQRPADEATAPVGRTVQAQKPPDPPAPGAAAVIDGQRRVERQGQLGPGVKRPCPVDVFDYPPPSLEGQDDSDRPQLERSAESAQSDSAVYAGEMDVDPASGPPPESQAAASSHAEAEGLSAAKRRAAVEPAPGASDALTSLLLVYDASDRSSDAQPNDAEERELEHIDEAPPGVQCVMFAHPSFSLISEYLETRSNHWDRDRQWRGDSCTQRRQTRRQAGPG